ncbi:MAG: hypothetical protein AB7C96_12685 [Hydrogenovibrio sp.]
MEKHDNIETNEFETNEKSTQNQNETIKTARRELLKKMAQNAKYAAPATIALMSMEAKACSFSC